jgi:protein SCO1/2
MRNSYFMVLSFVGIVLLYSCKEEPQRLPYLGNIEVTGTDTLYHIIPDISLIDQDSQVFHITSLKDKLVLADFFFTSCPSICPKVKKQMLRLYDRYKDDDRVMMISHTIDQRNDSVSVLNRYAYNLGVDTEKWKFVTGEKDSIFHLADQYFVSVVEDPLAPAGFDHSGRIILVDKTRRVRGFCEGNGP